MTPRAMTFVNAEIAGQAVHSLRLSHGIVDGLGGAPSAGDAIVDAGGERILPGLINAHDHLQLNNFPRVRYRARHDNVAQWIGDIDSRRGSDPGLADAAAVPRERRLLAGGIKNLLGGVTTVAHHDPFYPALSEPGFPCRVLADYGWAHSLGLDGELKVRGSYRSTPARTPWFIHAGEGVDAAAREEFGRLEHLGCIGPNTRLIHGVAFTAAERARLLARGAGLIWCPSSNLHLFGTTADCAGSIASGGVALGSDSRLSGAGDLLDELCVARASVGVPEASLETLVTTAGARLLGLADRGTLAPGALADCIVLPRELPLGVARRADLRCIVIGGAMVCGDADYARALMPRERRVPAIIDGRDKILDRALAELLRSLPPHDTGVSLEGLRGRAA